MNGKDIFKGRRNIIDNLPTAEGRSKSPFIGRKSVEVTTGFDKRKLPSDPDIAAIETEAEENNIQVHEYGQTFLSEGFVHRYDSSHEPSHTEVTVVNSDDAIVGAFVNRSSDAESENQKGEDAVSLALSEKDEKVLLCQADGVSQSFLGEIAARMAVMVGAKYPEKDIEVIVSKIASELEAIHSNLLMPDLNHLQGVAKNLMEETLEIARDDSGSQSMLSILKIDKNTGKVEGRFLSDSIVTIIRNDGQVKSCNSSDEKDSPDMVGTKDGVLGTAKTLNEVMGKGIILEKGDVILVHSDGLTVDEGQAIGKLLQQSKWEDAKKLFIGNHRTDDRSLVFYRQT